MQFLGNLLLRFVKARASSRLSGDGFLEVDYNLALFGASNASGID